MAGGANVAAAAPFEGIAASLFSRIQRTTAGDGAQACTVTAAEVAAAVAAGDASLLRGADEAGCTMLHAAATFFGAENDAIAALLIDAGCDVDCEDSAGRTPLFFAAANGHAARLQLLVRRGANVNHRNGFGSTPLHFAAANAQMEAAQLLMSDGADVHAVNQAGQAPLDYARRGGEGYSDPKLAELISSAVAAAA